MKTTTTEAGYLYQCKFCRSVWKDEGETLRCQLQCKDVIDSIKLIKKRRSWTSTKYKRLTTKINKTAYRFTTGGLCVQLMGRLFEEYDKICPRCFLYECKKHPYDAVKFYLVQRIVNAKLP